MAIREIFVRWEQLRLLYNLVLASVWCVMATHAYLFREIAPPELPLSEVVLQSAILALMANMLYFAGPIFESYLTWLGVQYKYQRHMVFIAGMLFSLVIEYGILTVMLSSF